MVDDIKLVVDSGMFDYHGEMAMTTLKLVMNCYFDLVSSNKTI
jgi:hypothetical protein